MHADEPDATDAATDASSTAPGYRLYDPAPPQDVIAYAAELLGLPIPVAVDFDAADMSPMARSFYAENRRGANGKAKRLLGWQPGYPTYREGLRALLPPRP